MENLLNNQFSITGQIESFSQHFAIIIIAGGQKISWPITNLPENCRVGDQVSLAIATPQATEEQKEILAKTILNQLLKNNVSPEK